MALFEFDVIFKEQGITQKSVQRKIATQAIKETMQEVGEYWHRHMLEPHFQPGAEVKYGYHSRQEKWRARKVRQTGQDVDLVFTGRMRDMMTSFARISGTSKRVRIQMDGPDYVYYHNKAREATRITPDEEQQLRKVADAFVEFAIRRIIADARPETTKV